MDVFGFAQFPYVSGALKYVEALDFKLDELFLDRVFGQVRERGKERVLSAIGEGIKKSVCTDRTGAEKELIAFKISEILKHPCPIQIRPLEQACN